MVGPDLLTVTNVQPKPGPKFIELHPWCEHNKMVCQMAGTFGGIVHFMIQKHDVTKLAVGQSLMSSLKKIHLEYQTNLKNLKMAVIGVALYLYFAIALDSQIACSSS